MGIIKDIFKIVSILGLIIAIFVSIFGYLAIRDAMDFRDKFPTEPNLFLLIEDGKVLAGASDVMHSNDPIPEDRTDYQGFIDNQDEEGLIGNNYKVFLVDMETFRNLPDGEIGDSGITKSELIGYLRDDNTRESFIDDAIKKADVPNEYEKQVREQFDSEAPSENDLRASFFFLLLSGVAEDSGPAFIVKEYKSGNIDVLPKTMVFRFISVLPRSAIERVESRMIQ